MTPVETIKAGEITAANLGGPFCITGTLGAAVARLRYHLAVLTWEHPMMRPALWVNGWRRKHRAEWLTRHIDPGEDWLS